jgi:hypothetical protein
MKAIIAVSDEGPRVTMTRFWSGDGDSQSCKRNEGKESDFYGREHD